MRRLFRPSLIWFLFAIVFPGCSGPQSSAQFGSGFTLVPATPEIRSMERRMAQRLNQDRAQKGLPPLTYDEKLADVARAHSADMRDHGFFAHESPNTGTLDDRMIRAGYLALEARENLAEAPDETQAEDQLLQSPKHYANIMSDTVSHIGIGIVKGGVHEATNYTFTQVFAQPGQEESLTEAQQSIAAIIAKQRRKAGLPPVSANPRLAQLAEQYIDAMPNEPSPDALQKIGNSVADELATTPIPGVRGVSVGGQLLWQSEQYSPSPALLQAKVRHYGLAIRRVTDANGRPQLKVLILLGL